MATLSDARNLLASLASTALYPNGTGKASAVGVTVTVVPGWPIPKQLDDIIAAGNAMVSVYQYGNMGKNTTRFLGDDDAQATIPAPNISLTISGNRVTVGGTIKAGEAPTLKVNYEPYSYSILASDTLNSVAAALAALIPGATASGPTITLANVFDVEGSISVPVTVQQEIGRQAQVFMVTAWNPTPDIRDSVCATLELALKQQPRIVMPDNTWARLLYRGTIEQDTLQKQRIYRRNLLYEIEYALTQPVTTNTVTNFGVTVTPTNGIARTTNI